MATPRPDGRRFRRHPDVHHPQHRPAVRRAIRAARQRFNPTWPRWHGSSAAGRCTAACCWSRRRRSPRWHRHRLLRQLRHFGPLCNGTTMVANTLGDLTRRECRFAHNTGSVPSPTDVGSLWQWTVTSPRHIRFPRCRRSTNVRNGWTTLLRQPWCRSAHRRALDFWTNDPGLSRCSTTR